MTSTPRLTRAITVHLAWWEDNDSWDGFALYLDEDTAKASAADDYESYEFGTPDPDDDIPRPLLTWETAYDRWHLLADGKDTGVRVGPMPVYRPSSAREIQQQDALDAAQKAARAAAPTPV
ncbi:hypothetical protein PYK79_48365 [Streptomyces sp. ID05-04B]|uniref:hypothetical protein n=1 Tax=Streptomyces sp. ID05-04B TaxID=3028661 RepID=UPI0029C3E77A|nr:hypothetical protein [Streptomyces sp. ID05-04B]MDX5569518.1 hypothetical protein [Streptomyces sp. ID05-04B]